MRIAYLLESTELCGGVKVVAQQAEALARRGHRVAVVSPRPAQEWFALRRAHLELSSFRDSQELEAAEVRVATFWTTVAPAVEGARGPVFHLCQGYEGDLDFYAGVRREIKDAYARPTRKLAITATLASKLAAKGFGPAANVGQAFDAQPFSPGPPRERSRPTVLLVGQYEGIVKGIDVALEGLAIWRARGGRFRVRRVSTQPPAAAETVSDLVDEYHHSLDPSRMPFAYRESDLFIGPSRPEEGFGLPVLEALASGLPCLLSDTPTHREVAGEAAWYFPDGDPEGLAAALPRLLTAEARARARVEGPRAAARFDTAEVAERLERAFVAALGGSGETQTSS
jgi:glycosyltransferase involved in cell wall biosynthesis